MKTKIELIDAPAHWAFYLTNNDTDCMKLEEITEIHAWLESENLLLSDCIDIQSDPETGDSVHHIARFNYPVQGYLQTDMYTYAFMKQVAP